jgi:hypothetical protein
MPVKQKHKSFQKMSPRELAAQANEFDEEFSADKFRAMTTAQEKKWDRARSGRGRPKVGEGVKVVSVSLEKSLLGSADKLANAKGIAAPS